MQQATHLLRLWDKEKRKFIDYRCYMDSVIDGIDIIKNCDDDKVLGYFDVDKNTYSFENESIGFSIGKISISDYLSDLLIAMKARIRSKSVQTSGQEKITTGTLF